MSSSDESIQKKKKKKSRLEEPTARLFFDWRLSTTKKATIIKAVQHSAPFQVVSTYARARMHSSVHLFLGRKSSTWNDSPCVTKTMSLLREGVKSAISRSPPFFCVPQKKKKKSLHTFCRCIPKGLAGTVVSAARHLIERRRRKIHWVLRVLSLIASANDGDRRVPIPTR